MKYKQCEGKLNLIYISNSTYWQKILRGSFKKKYYFSLLCSWGVLLFCLWNMQQHCKLQIFLKAKGKEWKRKLWMAEDLVSKNVLIQPQSTSGKHFLGM